MFKEPELSTDDEDYISILKERLPVELPATEWVELFEFKAGPIGSLITVTVVGLELSQNYPIYFMFRMGTNPNDYAVIVPIAEVSSPGPINAELTSLYVGDRNTQDSRIRVYAMCERDNAVVKGIFVEGADDE